MADQAWAVLDNGILSMKTVSDSRIGAIVNWLLVARRFMATKFMSDEYIESVWEQLRTEKALVVQVTVAVQERRFHRIIALNAGKITHITDIPGNDHANFPEWCEDLIVNGNKTILFDFDVDLDKDTVEYVPPVGPAPIWKETFSKFKSNQEMWEAFSAWTEKTF